MLLTTNAAQYVGKTIARLEDEFGAELLDMNMMETLVIVFTDGTKITLSTDYRGVDCYISQYEN